MSYILIHTNNEFILFNIIDYSIKSLYDPKLNNIYPKKLYNSFQFNAIIDTTNNIHAIIHGNNMPIILNNIYVSQLNDPLIIFNNITYIEKNIKLKILISQYYENLQIYKHELINVLFDNKGNSKIIHKHIDEYYDVHKMTKNDNYIYLYLNCGDISVIKYGFDFTRKIYTIKSNGDNIILHNPTTSKIICYNDKELYEATIGYIYDPSAGAKYWILKKYPIYNLHNIKWFNIVGNNLKMICYITDDNNIIIYNMKEDNTVCLGKIEESYRAYYFAGNIYFINNNNIIIIDLIKYEENDSISLKQNYVNYSFNISYIFDVKMNNFIWTKNTHKYLPNNMKYTVKIFMLCNRLQGIYKIPNCILYKILPILTKDIIF